MAISLEKRAEKVGIVLAKRGITQVPAIRVGAAFDVSGSARGFYSSGVMQETSERLMGVAMKFDDNGELDVWSFSDRYAAAPVATKENYASYINESFMYHGGVRGTLWGGTEYGPVIEAAVEHYFPVEKKSGFFGGLFGSKKDTSAATGEPAMLMLITDGANSDTAATSRILREAAGKPIYFMMVGVGPEHSFTFIDRMAQELPNVGFVNLNDLSISDDNLYEQLVSGEFATWVKQYVK